MLVKKEGIKNFLSERLDIQSKILKPRIMIKLIDWVNGFLLMNDNCHPECVQRFEHMNSNIERGNKNSLSIDLNEKINQ